MGEHEAPFLVYLAVWEQAVSAIQAPELIDPALGAGVPDTTRRTQVRWLPMAGRKLPWRDDNLTLLDPDAIIRAFHECNADPRHRPMLAARAHSGGEPEPGPETAPTAWGYRGVENQLYRVEIHRGGDAGEATFKWSRDNGSVEFGLDGLTEPDGEGVRTATLRRAWYDTRQGLEVGDWVEFVDDHWAPLGWPAALMQVTWVSLAMRQVKLHDTEGRRDFDAMLHPLLRRWDQHDGGRELQSGIPLHRADRRWFEIEDGVQIWFEAPRARCEHGDYWLIPARTATNGVLWPQSRDAGPGPLAIPPNGPARYLAPLVLLRQPPGEPVDLRVLFGYVPAPVTETVTPPPAPAGETGTTTTTGNRANTIHAAGTPHQPRHGAGPRPDRYAARAGHRTCHAGGHRPPGHARARYRNSYAARAGQRDRDSATTGNRANTIHAAGAPHQPHQPHEPRQPRHGAGPRPDRYAARAGHRTCHAAGRRRPARHAFRAGQ